MMKIRVQKILAVLILAVSSLYSGVFDMTYLQGRRDLLEAYDLLYKTYADSLDPSELMHAGLSGMTAVLDPYTKTLDNGSRFNFDVLSNGQYGGVGMSITCIGDTIRVVEITEGGPCESIGILPGDRLLAVDGDSLVGKSTEEAAEHLRGRADTDVTLTMARENGDIFHRIIIRKEIRVHSIRYADLISPGVLYVNLDRFTRHLARDLQTELAYFQRRYELCSIVLDLRNNGGGVLDEAVDLLDLLLPKGEKILETRSVHAERNREYYLKKDPVVADSVKLVVLINNSSASASEIVAGAIQDLDRGVIAGQSSHGKGLVQNIVRVSRDRSLKLTTSKYYIPSGRLLQKQKYLKNNKAVLTTLPGNPVYRTRKGRVVNGNGGITPDTLLAERQESPIVRDLVCKNLFFEYVRYKAVYTPGSDMWTSQTGLVEDFLAFLDKRDYEFKNPLITSLDSIKNKLDALGYTTRVTDHRLDLVEQKIRQGDKLEDHKEALMRLLNIEKQRFDKGAAAGLAEALKYDSQVAAAAALCRNDAYEKLLSTP